MGFEAERRPLDDGHAFGFQQVGHDVGVAPECRPRGRPLADQPGTGRIDVERALGRRAGEARRSIEHGDDQVAPLPEHPHPTVEEVPRPVEGRGRGRLADRARVRGALGLDHVHGLDQPGGAASVADAPSRHGVGLRHAVDGQGPVVQRGFDPGDGREVELVVDDVFVHVVRHRPDVGMARQDLRQGRELGFRVGRARRIRGRVEQQPLGPRRDRRLQILGLHLETRFQARRHENRRPAPQQHHVRVGDPVGRRNDDLVAGVERRDQGVVQDLLAAAAHRDLVHGIVEAVLPLELPRDRLAQLGGAGRRRVLGLPPADGLDRRFLDEVGRVEVGLAGAQPDDVAARGLELVGLRRDRDGRRGLDRVQIRGEHGHGVTPGIEGVAARRPGA